MKAIRTLILVTVSFCICQKANSQTVNWNSLKDSKHILFAGIAWDYSVSYNLGYAHHFKTKVPLLLSTKISVPSGKKLIDDFKTIIGWQVLLLNKSNLKGSVALNGIYRRYENPLVRLQNFGTELKGTFGYYKPKWFVAGEIGFDKAIVTHFKHSEIFKETIYSDVKDGWFEPATGGNFMYGIQTGYSFNKSDITLNIGMLKTQNFKTTPLVPYYVVLGYNYKIN